MRKSQSWDLQPAHLPLLLPPLLRRWRSGSDCSWICGRRRSNCPGSISPLVRQRLRGLAVDCGAVGAVRGAGPRRHVLLTWLLHHPPWTGAPQPKRQLLLLLDVPLRTSKYQPHHRCMVRMTGHP